MGSASDVFAFQKTTSASGGVALTNINGKWWKSDGRATVLEIPLSVMYRWGF